MANATGSQHAMEYVAEVTYGTTPATPAMTPIRHNTTSLGLSKETFQSAEIRSDRQITDFRHGNKQVGGDIVGELSYGTYDDFLEATLGGTWATDTPALGTDQLKAGTDLGSFTVRRRFTDLSSVQQVFTGVQFTSMAVTINSQIASVTFSTLGKDMSTTNITGATVNAASTTEPFSGLDVGTIQEGGSAIASVTEVSFTLENGLSPNFALGSDTTLDPSSGRSNITGTINAYFQNQTLLDKFINETDSSLDVSVTDPAGNLLRIFLPRIVYSGGQPDVGGEGVIILSMPFQALYDTTTSTNIVIERNPV